APAAALARAADALRDAGAQVLEVHPPWDEDPTELFFACVAADGGAQLRDGLGAGVRHHPRFQALIDAVERNHLSAGDWFAVQRRVYGLRARMRALAASV